MIVEESSEEAKFNILDPKLQEGFIKLFHKNVKNSN